MRELKFKTWDTERKRFVGDGEIIFKDYGETSIYVCPNSQDYIGDKCHYGGSQGSRFIVIQFTGFYCKNTKVYDGWILKHPKSTEPEEKGWIVVWKDFGWKLKCVNLVNGEELFTELSDYFANDCDVIGNIYENPELLS